jgi:hypothetical protein
MLYVSAVFLTLSATAGRADCLSEAVIFAQKICGEIKTAGKSTLVTANGDLNAQAKGLIAKALGELGGNVGVTVETGSFDNVVHEQLGAELSDNRKCGTAMAKAAMDQVCTKAPNWKTCTNPAFGLEKWGNEEPINGTSGFRGGGYNQAAYCNDLINATLQARGLGSQPHLTDQIGHSEESRRTGAFGSGPVQYNYHCSFMLHWNPVYNRRADPLCGQESAN